MNRKRLPASLVHSYGLSHATFNIMMFLALNYYTFFLTDVALIAAGHLAVLMFITHLVDAASIPIGGAIIQKTQFRWGQYSLCLWLHLYSLPSLFPIYKVLTTG
jgi:Na+/melibiose symporter-like transporter